MIHLGIVPGHLSDLRSSLQRVLHQGSPTEDSILAKPDSVDPALLQALSVWPFTHKLQNSMLGSDAQRSEISSSVLLAYTTTLPRCSFKRSNRPSLRLFTMLRPVREWCVPG